MPFAAILTDTHWSFILKCWVPQAIAAATWEAGHGTELGALVALRQSMTKVGLQSPGCLARFVDLRSPNGGRFEFGEFGEFREFREWK